VRREHWWNLGEAQAVAVYRAKFLLPLLVLWGTMALPFVIFPDMRRSGAPFVAAVWITLLLPILIRRRRAAIFTPEAFIFRPAIGRISKVPLSAIKRAYLLEPDPGAEYDVPTVRVELLVGGNMDIRLGVRNPEEIARRLNNNGETLGMPPNKPLQPTVEKRG
jgi:hypothetical protein